MPESLFYPTARQLYTLLKSRYDDRKVLVIIAGSSVLRGTGQPTGYEWSRFLQNYLGDGYEVLNLAVNAGAPTGYGFFMALQAIRDGQKTVFIINPRGDYNPPMRQFEAYQYFYYDAQSRGMIPDFYAAKITAGFESGRLHPLTMTEKEKANELRLRAWFNAASNAQELWTALGYSSFFTVFTQFSWPDPFWRGKRFWRDSESIFYPSYLADKEDIEIYNKNIEIASAASAVDKFLPSDWAQVTLDDQLAKNTIAIVDAFSPFYVQKLPPDKRENFELALSRTREDLSKTVFAALSIESRTVDDYIDLTHLSPSGGEKMDCLLAQEIRRLAKAREWTP